MIALGVVALQGLACLGLGAAVLRLSGVVATLGAGERAAWAFALGFGVLGWLLFFFGAVGAFHPVPLLDLLVAGLGANALWLGVPAPAATHRESPPLGAVGWLLLAGLAVAAVFGILEALAPPSDGDALTYHFALPKQFLAAGRLLFVPRAVEAAAPLLVQMTYVPALGLGGERALTLWTLVSAWGTTALLYTVARRHLERRWSLAVALLFATTPAVVYGSVSGQVEVRNALFVVVAACAVAAALRTGQLRHAAVAGLAVGFFMGAKYIGLLFAAACGVTILAQRRWLAHGAVLTVAALVAGGQWYAWNWAHTGDPVFPLLFGIAGHGAAPYWDAAHQEALRAFMAHGDKAVPANLFWLLAYPFVATVAGFPVFESGRTGLGPFVLLALPFAAAGAWRFRSRLKRSPLTAAAVITLIFYVLWFLFGSSQRVRFFVPVYPLLLLSVAVAAERWAAAAGTLRPLGAAVLATCVLQLGGHGVFALNFARHLLSGEGRDAFLARTVSDYAPVPWINAHLKPTDRVFLLERQLVYLIDVPVFFGHRTFEARIDVSPRATDPRRFFRQLRAQHITHLLVGLDDGPPPPARGIELWRALVARGCAVTVRDFETRVIDSRTLAASATTRGRMRLLKLTDGPCNG